MQNWKRREFLGASMAGFAAGTSWINLASHSFAAEKDKKETKKEGHEKSKDPKSPGPDAPDTLMLTWQRDPTTTMTVQWLDLDTPARGAVHLAKWKNDDWEKHSAEPRPYQNTDLKLYRCEFTGLVPDTEYQLRVSGTGQILRFRTMPAKATDTIQFVSGGDSGIGSDAQRINGIAARQEPRFALLGGDVAYDNGKSPETFTQFLRNWHSQMVDSEGRLIPLISCIGNHEVQGKTTDRRMAPQYLSFFDGIFPETTYGVLDIGDYLSLILLDSGHLCPVEGEQTDWLEKTLKERGDRPHVIAAYHVPAYPSYRVMEGKNGKPGTGHAQRENWCPLFERYQVDVVLEHHDHTFKRSLPLTNGMYDKNGVLYLGDGSWGKLRALNEPAMRPYLARVSSHNHMMVHRLEGNDRFHVALDANGKVADVCHSTSKRPAKRG